LAVVAPNTATSSRVARGDHGQLDNVLRAQWAPIPTPDTPFETITTLFPVNALVACVG
jgi:hypothetical protein